jgi:hypothetical protein
MELMGFSVRHLRLNSSCFGKYPTEGRSRSPKDTYDPEDIFQVSAEEALLKQSADPSGLQKHLPNPPEMLPKDSSSASGVQKQLPDPDPSDLSLVNIPKLQFLLKPFGEFKCLMFAEDSP